MILTKQKTIAVENMEFGYAFLPHSQKRRKISISYIWYVPIEKGKLEFFLKLIYLQWGIGICTEFEVKSHEKLCVMGGSPMLKYSRNLSLQFSGAGLFSVANLSYPCFLPFLSHQQYLQLLCFITPLLTMTAWLSDSLTVRLSGSLTKSDGRIVWMSDFLTNSDCLIVWLYDCLPVWQNRTVWLSCCLNIWFSNKLWLSHCLNVLLSYCLTIII